MSLCVRCLALQDVSPQPLLDFKLVRACPLAVRLSLGVLDVVVHAGLGDYPVHHVFLQVREAGSGRPRLAEVVLSAARPSSIRGVVLRLKFYLWKEAMVVSRFIHSTAVVIV